MNKLLFITLFLIPLQGICQAEKIGIVNDSDGFINVRSGKAYNAAIVGRLFNDDVVMFTPTNDDWIEIYKQTYFEPVTGFIHKSRLRDFELMSEMEKKQHIKNIFTKELELVEPGDFSEAYQNHHESKFNMILNLASDEILKTKDVALATLFVKIIKLNAGSADEIPPSVLGWMFIQEPDWMSSIIEEVGVDESLLGSLGFGIYDMMGPEPNDSTALKYKEIVTKFEQLK